jgi:hypothetical protein
MMNRLEIEIPLEPVEVRRRGAPPSERADKQMARAQSSARADFPAQAGVPLALVAAVPLAPVVTAPLAPVVAVPQTWAEWAEMPPWVAPKTRVAPLF